MRFHSTLMSKNYNFDCCTHAAIYFDGMVMEMGRVCVRRWRKWRCALPATLFSHPHKNRCFFQPNEKYLHVAEYKLPSLRCHGHNSIWNDTFYRFKSSSELGKKEKKKRFIFRSSEKKINWKTVTEIGAPARSCAVHISHVYIFGFVLRCVNLNERLEQFRRTPNGNVSLYYVIVMWCGYLIRFSRSLSLHAVT